MMTIADNMVTDVLEELDLALDINRRGNKTSTHFEIGGNLSDAGSVWMVKAEDSALKGMTIRCLQAGSWSLGFEGDYAFVVNYQSNEYPTRFNIIANQVVATEESPAQGWDILLEGDREERSGYRCTFTAGNSYEFLSYLNTRGAGARGWDQVFGDLYMKVLKDNTAIDMCCLSFEGSPSQATFVRGL